MGIQEQLLDREVPGPGFWGRSAPENVRPWGIHSANRLTASFPVKNEPSKQKEAKRSSSKLGISQWLC